MKNKIIPLIFILFLLNISQASELNETQADRWHKLTQQFRCPTCQNESIADSPVGLAADLRAEIKKQIIAGKSDQEITTFMVERYGNFINYQPPFKPSTAILWLMPLIFILIMLYTLLRTIHRQQKDKP